MKKLERSEGKKAGCRAELHEYRSGIAKIEIELPLAEARRLMEQAVTSGGSSPIQVTLGQVQIDTHAIGARIDSFDDLGRKIGGTGVIAFASLEEKT